MKALIRTLLVALTLGLAAPACFVHTTDPEPETVMVGFRSRPACSPSRYWNGNRCVKKRWAHYHQYHRHHEHRRYHWD